MQMISSAKSCMIKFEIGPHEGRIPSLYCREKKFQIGNHKCLFVTNRDTIRVCINAAFHRFHICWLNSLFKMEWLLTQRQSNQIFHFWNPPYRQMATLSEQYLWLTLNFIQFELIMTKVSYSELFQVFRTFKVIQRACQYFRNLIN